MKKVLAFVLVLCMVIGAVGCTSKPAQAPAAQEQPAAQAQPATETEAPAEAPAEEEASEESKELTAPDGYGKKDITMVVPLTAGGAFDQAARKLSAIVNELYGLNVVVQNVEGGSGLTGMTQVLTSKPDGYTLAFYSIGFVGNIVMGRFDLPIEIVDPLISITTESQMICVNSNSPYQTFDDLVAAIKANPGTITMATPGSLSSQHVGVLALSEQIFGEGVYDGITQMPYPGGARICADLIGESIIDSGILKSSEIYSAYQAGQVRPLVVVGPERMTLCPDVPTLTELGYEFLPYYSGILNSTCIYAPSGVDPEIREYLIQVFNNAALSDEFQEYVASQDAQSNPLYGDALKEAIDGRKRIVVGSSDTDGTDGPGGRFNEEAWAQGCRGLSGAVVDGYTMTRAKELGVDVEQALRTHASSDALWRMNCGLWATQNISINDIILVLVMDHDG